MSLRWEAGADRYDAQELLDGEGNAVAVVSPYRGAATRSSARPDAWEAWLGDRKLGRFGTIREAKGAVSAALAAK